MENEVVGEEIEIHDDVDDGDNDDDDDVDEEKRNLNLNLCLCLVTTCFNGSILCYVCTKCL
jgi:hypothetical protein